MLSLAREEDHAGLVALVNLAYRGHGADAASGTSWNAEDGLMEGPRITVPYLREDLAAKPQAHLLVHRDPEGVLLGSVWLEPLAQGDWYLSLLAVRPGMQDSGLGRRMLAACEAYVADQGGRGIRMSVMNVRHSLIAWYERRGFERTGETEPFPYGVERFGRPLRADLEFVVLAKPLDRP